jgi:hypothetical protein
MHLSHLANKLMLSGAFLLCIALGFELAVLLKERLEGTAEVDPCFGQGELVDEWTANVSQQEIDAAAVSRPELRDAEAGPTEFRKCRSGPGYEVVLDSEGRVFSFTQPSPEELESYYKEHPDKDPANAIATSQAKSKQEMAVTPALPDATVMAESVLAGCDSSWQTKDFPTVGLRLCYPSDWQILRDDAEVWIGDGVTTMYFTAKASGELLPDCPDPTTVATSNGDAKLCEARPNLVEEGQGRSLILPNQHEARYFIAKPTPDNKWMALRIALSAEELP